MKNRSPYKIIVFAIVLAFTLLSIGCHADEGNASTLDLYVFSCGKADAILLQFDGHNVLVDTGENGDGEEIVTELESKNVEKIDLLILTHHDKDHIGGADVILDRLPVSEVRMPDYEIDSKQYAQLDAALSKSSANIIRMQSDDSFSIGSADFKIWTSTIPFNGKNDNEQSLITKVYYNGKTILLMGDAEDDWLKDLCFSGRNLTCDIMKLPHHGVYDKNLIALFAVTMPEYVIVTDSAKNPAEAETLSLLNTFDCNVYRTALGTIRLSVHNKSVTVQQ